MPHERWGEALHAFVILRDGAEVTEEELRPHVRNNLAHFKTPQRVSFVDQLPKTATGMVQKWCCLVAELGSRANNGRSEISYLLLPFEHSLGDPRALPKRVAPKTPDNWPNMIHAGCYSATLHYLKAVM